MSRGTKAIVRLSALAHNLERIHQLAPKANVWAVVKANAYGHGAVAVANYLQDRVSGFAVATLDEALELRESGIQQRILLLEGVTSEGQSLLAAEMGFDLVVHQQQQLAWLERLHITGLQLWLKLDTGMHRLGLPLDGIEATIARLRAHPAGFQLGLMSHFASADEPDSPWLAQQRQRLAGIQQQFPDLPCSFANSAAVVGMPDTHADWIRPGIMLYGASPFAERQAQQLGLRPVMSLVAPVIALRQVPKGDAVGYGASWVAERDSQIATLAVGYADGYPRSVQAGTPVAINGQLAPLVGRVSMDLITIDVTGLSVAVGDLAELWGEQVSVDQVAAAAGTLGYELLTRRSLRVPLAYTLV